jgi:hypothetical protein
MSLPSLLEAIRNDFQSKSFSLQWLSQAQLVDRIDEISHNLSRDQENLRTQAGFIFSTADEVESHTRRTIDLFRLWAISGACPSLLALIMFSLDHLRVKDDGMKKMAIAAAILGEIDNNNAYHNNMHFRKVVFQMIRMIAMYNFIYEGTSRAFDDRQICTLLASACIHDLAHDGKGNTIKGVYIPHRLEQNSFDIAAQVFRALDLGDDQVLNNIRTILLCTDVTPINDPANAINQAKAAYRFHFLGGKKHMDGLNLDDDLKKMETCPVLAVMCLMMHEADIATSAGLHYSITKYETGLLRAEIGDGIARPEHVIDFLRDICNRQMLSEVGQRLYAANLARIYALAEEDFKRGNEPFPDIARSEFMSGSELFGEMNASRTIN